jgi:DNA repair exonuclease SbcCD nuclease subunit
MSRPVIVVGDIHGYFDALKDVNLSGCDVYQVGDFGLGFSTKHKDMADMSDLNDFGVSHDINFFALRGNHDMPSFWNDEEINENFNEFSNIELIPDYTYKTINDKKTLFIGGATSIDRCLRKEGLEYWKDEAILKPKKKLESCDMVISHNCPSLFEVKNNKKGDIVDTLSRKDPKLIEDLLKERQILDEILLDVQPSQWYFGHFHLPKAGNDNGCLWRCLTINEKKEVNFHLDKPVI